MTKRGTFRIKSNRNYLLLLFSLSLSLKPFFADFHFRLRQSSKNAFLFGRLKATGWLCCVIFPSTTKTAAASHERKRLITWLLNRRAAKSSFQNVTFLYPSRSSFSRNFKAGQKKENSLSNSSIRTNKRRNNTETENELYHRYVSSSRAIQMKSRKNRLQNFLGLNTSPFVHILLLHLHTHTHSFTYTHAIYWNRSLPFSHHSVMHSLFFVVMCLPLEPIFQIIKIGAINEITICGAKKRLQILISSRKNISGSRSLLHI